MQPSLLAPLFVIKVTTITSPWAEDGVKLASVSGANWFASLDFGLRDQRCIQCGDHDRVQSQELTQGTPRLDAGNYNRSLIDLAPPPVPWLLRLDTAYVHLARTPHAEREP